MRVIRHATLLLALLCGIAPAPPAGAQSGEVLDEIVAVVGDYIVLKSDVDGMVAGMMNQQRVPYSDELWRAAVNQLVNENVLVIHAKRDTNLVVTDQQVDQTLDDRIKQMSAQVGGEAKLEEIYRKSIIEIKTELREEFRDRILADQFRNNKLRSIKATPSDVRQWFSSIPTDSLPTLPEIVRVSHIVRKPVITDEARSEAMEIISTIRDTIVAGKATIEDMAKLFSDDPGSASNGGFSENMSLAELVPEFAAVASRSPIGVISQVFETQYGLHILRVNARRGDTIDYNHILVAFDPRKSDPAPAIAFLNVLRDSILTKGAVFQVLARENSEDQESAARGGRVTDPNSGERNLFLANLGGRWQSTILQLQEGDISTPTEVELEDGTTAYHIVLLEKRIPPHVVNMDTDYELIENGALRDKQSRVMDKWLSDLRKDVYIDMRGTARDLSIADNRP